MRKVFKSKFLTILLMLALLLPCLVTTPVVAAGSYPYTASSTEVSAALTYLEGQQTSTGMISDFSTSSWAVMAVVAAGEDPHDWKVGSNPSIVDYLSTNAGSATGTNDYSRMILAIVAADEAPTNFGGVDFVTLLEAAYSSNQIGDSSLLNDDFWGVMALITAGESSSSTIVSNSVTFILNNQNTDGGWSWGVGQDSDADDTAAAIMALMAAGQSASSTPIINALAYLKGTQGSNGGFLSWGSTNSATDSWGIDGIVAAGQDPTATGWEYSSTSKDPIDDLLTFQNTDGSFNWTSGTPSNKALMTSYAITALLGEPWPVAVLQPTPTPTPTPTGVTVDVRIEGQTGTIWSGTVTVTDSTIIDDTGGTHYLADPTALGALDEASQVGSFPYVVKNSAYGLYIYSIDGEEPAGLAGCMYWVDYYSPMVGASDFILGTTTPPAAPHGEILFAYSEWGQEPLKVAADDTTPDVGHAFTATVTEYDESAGTWSLVEGATVHADQDYTTGTDGTVAITISSNMTVSVYAEKDNYIRSNRVTVTVGTGTSQSSTNGAVNMSATIIPAISFNVSPSSIGFGTLGPDDTSDPHNITITNLGAWKLKITADVTDTAENLYVSGLKLNGVTWNVFSTTVARNGNNQFPATLTVPTTYTGTGLKSGTLIFWAEDGR